jgi:hypothetical protein
MIPLGMVMLDVFAQRPPQGALTKENDLRQTLVLYRVWSKYWSEASISSIENLIALITVPVPHRRPG